MRSLADYSRNPDPLDPIFGKIEDNRRRAGALPEPLSTMIEVAALGFTRIAFQGVHPGPDPGADPEASREAAKSDFSGTDAAKQERLPENLAMRISRSEKTSRFLACAVGNLSSLGKLDLDELLFQTVSRW